MKKRIVLISHNIFGFECLKEMVKMDSNIVGVITRKYTPTLSDFFNFREFCEKKGIPLFEVENINSPESKEILRKLQPDFVFVFGWSQIIKKEILSLAKEGFIGAHPAILPKNRGNAAIPWQILNQEKRSGLTLFYMDEGLDSGDIIVQEVFELSELETAQSFYNKVIEAGKRIIRRDLEKILSGKVTRKPQEHSAATYLARRRPEDGLIDWSQSADYICRLVRAVGRPYPGAFTYYNFKKVIILEAEPSSKPYCGTIGEIVKRESRGIYVQCGDGLVLIKRVSVDGKEVNPSSYFKVGRRLGMLVEKEIVSLKERIEELEKIVQELQKKLKVRNSV